MDEHTIVSAAKIIGITVMVWLSFEVILGLAAMGLSRHRRKKLQEDLEKSFEKALRRREN